MPAERIRTVVTEGGRGTVGALCSHNICALTVVFSRLDLRVVWCVCGALRAQRSVQSAGGTGLVTVGRLVATKRKCNSSMGVASPQTRHDL